MPPSPITCHVLDSSTGKPAAAVSVTLYRDGEATALATGETNSDGRCIDLLPPEGSAEAKELVTSGVYKIIFRTKEYFASTNRKSFYPWVEIIFELENVDEHYHIPLLISPYSYTTYRGS